MVFITIKNTTSYDISFLKQYAQRLKPFLSLVGKQYYPFRIVVVEKKYKTDRSNFDTKTQKLILKYSPQLQSKQDLVWVLFHEFAHFLSLNNTELFKVAFSKEAETIEKVLEKKYGNKYDWHDILPWEVFANGFATVLLGKFRKRHFINKPDTRINETTNKNRNNKRRNIRS